MESVSAYKTPSLRVGHVAKLLGVDETTVRRWCKLGWLPHSKQGYQFRFSIEQAREIVQAMKEREEFNNGPTH